MFITFEGIKGAGKSLQASLLCVKLNEVYPYREVLYFSEPKGTALGQHVRSIKKDPEVELSPLQELLITAAARSSAADEEILPALLRGAIVISDQFIDSTIAYFIHGLGMPEEQVRSIAKASTGSLTPDLTLFLDIEPDVAHMRLHRHKGSYYSSNVPGKDLLRKVNTGFAKILAENTSDRFRVIDGESSVNEIGTIAFSEVAQALEKSSHMSIDAVAREAKAGSAVLEKAAQVEKEDSEE